MLLLMLMCMCAVLVSAGVCTADDFSADTFNSGVSRAGVVIADSLRATGGGSTSTLCVILHAENMESVSLL